MADEVSLYDRDFVEWTEQQAAAIRAAAEAGGNLPIDWENVAEEIESLGKSLRRELASHLTTIVEHLLKLQHSPAQHPRPGWISTIVRARAAMEDLLEESPSLQAKLDALIARANQNAAKIVMPELQQRGEIGRETSMSLPHGFTAAEIMGAWFPERVGPGATTDA